MPRVLMPARTLRGRVNRGLQRILHAAAGGGRNRRVTVFMYHSVDETGSLLSVRPDDLRRHLSFMQREGCRALTAAEFVDRLGRPQGAANEVFLTFDDGYENFYTEAAPILAEYGFPATVFVVTDCVGGRPVWLGRDEAAIDRLVDTLPVTRRTYQTLGEARRSFADMRLMGWDQLRDLVGKGIDIQSHSASHHFLTALPAGDVAADLRRSIATLEDRLGASPRLLGYPYGVCDDQVARIARETGFSGALLAEYSGPSADPLRIGRVALNGGMGAFDIRFALSPALERHAALRRTLRAWWGGRGR